MAQQIEAKPEYLRSLAIRCLQWVFYSTSPLYVEELQFALATFDDYQNAREFELDDIDLILGACANLLVLDSTGRYGTSDLAMVRPAHYSVEEYFTTHKLDSTSILASHLLDPGKVHADLALICLAHLKQPMMIFGELEVRHTSLCLAQDPFLAYAALSFDSHVFLGVDFLETQVQDFLESGEQLLQNVLFTRATYRLPWLMCFLSSTTQSIAPGWDEFKQAAIRSHWGAALMVDATLLGRLPNIREHYATPEGAAHALEYACRCNDHGRVSQLLDDGADPNVQTFIDGSILHVALRIQSDRTEELLIERGADVNACDVWGASVLQFAAMTASPEIVELLLDKGADINARGGEWGNALYAATIRDNHADAVPIVELLVQHGADVNARGGHCGTALAAAAYLGRQQIAEILLSNGANVNVEDLKMLPAYLAERVWDRWNMKFFYPAPVLVSPLYHACLEGHVGVARTLLDYGADPNLEEGSYGNAMFASLEETDSPWIVALLIQRGFHADVDTLTTAASRGRKFALVEILSPDNGSPEFSDIDIGVALVAVWRSEEWNIVVGESSVDAERSYVHVGEPDTASDESDNDGDESKDDVDASKDVVDESKDDFDEKNDDGHKSDVSTEDSGSDVERSSVDFDENNRKAVIDMLKMRLRFNVELEPDDAIDRELDTFSRDEEVIIRVLYAEDSVGRGRIVFSKRDVQSHRDSLVDDLEDDQVGDHDSTDRTWKSIESDEDLSVAQVHFSTESCENEWWFPWLLDEDARFL